MINDNSVKFSTLYKLYSDAKSRGISPQRNILFTKRMHLNSLHKRALKILNAVRIRKSSKFEQVASDDEYNTYLALKWMLETGYRDDGLSKDYDEVLDAAAALLIKRYRDKNVLPLIADLMFSRYREGRYIYDLIWAYFEYDDPESLLYIGKRLQSSNSKDVELACKLLCFIPGICDNEGDSPAQFAKFVDRHDDVKRNIVDNIGDGLLNDNDGDGPAKYAIFMKWFNENKNYLYRTMESFHQFNSPQIYEISLEAKYLCIPVSHKDGKFKRQLTEHEKQCLSAFMNMDDNTKVLLANYSNFLFRQNYYEWNVWIHYPIYEQIRIATAARVGGI